MGGHSLSTYHDFYYYCYYCCCYYYCYYSECDCYYYYVANYVLYFEMSRSIADWYDGYMSFHRCLSELHENAKKILIKSWYFYIRIGCIHITKTKRRRRRKQYALYSPEWMCFFWRALEFWNHTCVTRLLSPVTDAIRSKSCPSGLLSIWKLACNTCNCSSVNVVRTRFALLLW